MIDLFEVVKFVCQICKEEFDTEADAQKCEDNHCAAEIIAKQIFIRKDDYPIRIHVEMSNGKTCVYELLYREVET